MSHKIRGPVPGSHNKTKNQGVLHQCQDVQSTREPEHTVQTVPPVPVEPSQAEDVEMFASSELAQP